MYTLPYLIPTLLEMLPEHVKIIDSGEAVARQTKAILKDHKLLNTQNVISKAQFYTNGKPEVMQQLINANYCVEYLDF